MSYFKPEDLKKFGEITDLQPEMGRKFFAWYKKFSKMEHSPLERKI